MGAIELSMHKIKALAHAFRLELYVIFAAILVLWQMLLPGYILTLDMTFGPVASTVSFVGLSAAGWPMHALLAGLHYILSGWIVEKVVLFMLFFFLFYLPLKFYPFASKYGERYITALVFAVNPFVYERLLAGQWGVLFGYALLFPFIAGLIGLARAPERRRAIYTFLWLLAIGVFSLHFLAIGLILLVVFALIEVRSWKLLKNIAIGVILFALLSCYWLIPTALTTGATRLETFTPSQWSAFGTASGSHIGLEGNVAALYGFWGEHEPLMERFVLPKDEGAWWYGALAAMALLMLVGAYAGLRSREYRRTTVFLLIGGFLAFVFSCGVNSHIFGGINNWLFEHIGFWTGFRDSEKWSGALALTYALLAGLGTELILERIPKRTILLILCALPIAYTPTLLFGAVGQLQPVWYPQSWYQADAIVKQSPDCTALFLPWQEYYSPKWDNNFMLAGNLAPGFFHCTIISGQDIELDDVGTPSGFTSQYYAIEKAVTSNTADPDQTITLLKEQGIRYIIFTNDISRIDPYTYPFLGSSKLQKVLSTSGLALFRVL